MEKNEFHATLHSCYTATMTIVVCWLQTFCFVYLSTHRIFYQQKKKILFALGTGDLFFRRSNVSILCECAIV